MDSGNHSVLSEVCKDGVVLIHCHLTKMWKISQDFKDGKIVIISKKGDRADCDNFHVMSLPTVACILDAKVILDRLQPILETAFNLTEIFILNKGDCKKRSYMERGRRRDMEHGLALGLATETLVPVSRGVSGLAPAVQVSSDPASGLRHDF